MTKQVVLINTDFTQFNDALGKFMDEGYKVTNLNSSVAANQLGVYYVLSCTLEKEVNEKS